MRWLLHGLLFIAVLLSYPCKVSSIESAEPFEDRETHLWGYKASNGEVIIKPQFLVAEHFSAHGTAAVADDAGWKYIDREGKVIMIPFILDNGPDPFREGLARFKEGDKFGYFDERGRVIIPPCFDFAAPFSEGFAAFCRGCREHREGEHGSFKGGTWGFIDGKGETAIAPTFEAARSFEHGKAQVMLDGRWVTIGKTGDLVQ